jgi:flagellum-specific peptidoglycan hydrolase FlgJ
MNDLQRAFLTKATAEAAKVNHPFPRMAACEAALESAWGNSALAREANNLFGMKQHCHPIYGTMTLPTREFVGKEKDAQDGICDGWIAVNANWVSYPGWAECFADRLATLQRLSNAYPHYAAALRATDAKTYVAEVSKSWSTDPDRAKKVIAFYDQFDPAPPAKE